MLSVVLASVMAINAPALLPARHEYLQDDDADVPDASQQRTPLGFRYADEWVRRSITGGVSCLSGSGCCAGSWGCLGCSFVALAVAINGGSAGGYPAAAAIGGMAAACGAFAALSACALLPVGFVLDMFGIWDWRTAVDVMVFFAQLALRLL